ncbi:SusC/RagA family TonB-linked outer membrane protein [Parafilimonas sp.]|uniref:SusC/RagA family TonB-linked outer membrane protein n=1 Tax=Parafilimonas sp. TaxID=1969739 RepID=UPI0039E45E73
MRFKTIYIRLFIMIIFPLCAKAQEHHTITGFVISSPGKAPLAGASIGPDSSRIIAITDDKGRFVIVLPDSIVALYAKHEGYITQAATVNRQDTIMYITLQENVNSLEDVTVSTGYEVLPKERITGAFTKVGNRQLNEQAGSNIINRLKGVTSSLLFDNSESRPPLTIRGISTFEGPSAPLIVVDNFPYEGDIQNINPNDVENITVLKDAAAASIWGTRAGNGVIVITTKKGRLNQPLRVQVNANATLVQKPDLFYLPQMNAADFIDVETWLFNQQFYDENSYNHAALTPVVELLIKQRDGIITPADATAQINALKQQDVRNDYDKYIYRQGINQQYAINVNGGNNKSAYYFSAGYDKNIDNLDAAYQRIQLKLQNTFHPFKNLQASIAVSYTNSNNKAGRPGYGQISTITGDALYPYAQLAGNNGAALPLIKDYRQAFIDTAGQGLLLDWHYYPLDDYKHINDTKNLDDLLANVNIQYTIVKGLNATLQYNYERQTINYKALYDAESYYARDLINQFTQIDFSTGAISYPVPKGGILDMSNNSLQSNNLRAQLNYAYHRNNNELYILAGGEVRQNRTVGSSHRTYGYNNDVLGFTNVDLANGYTSYVTGFETYIPGNNAFSDKLYRFSSLYGNATYTYKSRYTITGSVRKDASNLFGVNRNDRGIPLWSAGGGWIISKEQFYHCNFMPLLKLRMSYGYSGNADLNRSAVTTMSYISNARFTNLTYANITQFANPELGWEITKTINAGIDFTVKNNIAGGSIDYYWKKGFNLFGPSALDQTTGLQRPAITKNVADMLGHGLDADVYINPVNRQFKWSMHFLFSYNLSKVTNYYLEDSNGADYAGNEGVAPVKGKPVFSLMSFKWAGLTHDTGDPQGYIDGKASTDYDAIFNGGTTVNDLDFIGPSVPPYFGSLHNNFSWKNIELAINITYRLGYYFRKGSINYSQLFYGWYGNADYAKRWQQPGDELHTSVPSLVYPNDYYRDNFYVNSSALVEKADNIKLEYINLNYTLDKKHLQNVPFQSLRLYFYVNNVGILWRANKDGLDPDYPNALKPGTNFTFGLTADL